MGRRGSRTERQWRYKGKPFVRARLTQAPCPLLALPSCQQGDLGSQIIYAGHSNASIDGYFYRLVYYLYQ